MRWDIEAIVLRMRLGTRDVFLKTSRPSLGV